MKKTAAQLDAEIADILAGPTVGPGAFKPGQRVTCTYRGEHVGTVLSLDDPRAWANTHAFPQDSPKRQAVKEHVLRHPTVGVKSIPVLYPFGVQWDHRDCLSAASGSARSSGATKRKAFSSPTGRTKSPALMRRRHAAKKSVTTTAAAKAAKAGPTDRITIDQLAKLLGLPDWESVDERNQHNYWEMSRGAEDEDAQIEAEQKVQEEVYRQWYDAVEQVAENLFGEHGLEFQAMKNVRKLHQNYRPHDLKIIPTKSWDDAANKLRETINGVGDERFNSLREFLDSGPYTARQAVLANLGYIKRYPAVYGGSGANQMYERAWR